MDREKSPPFLDLTFRDVYEAIMKTELDISTDLFPTKGLMLLSSSGSILHKVEKPTTELMAQQEFQVSL